MIRRRKIDDPISAKMRPNVIRYSRRALRNHRRQNDMVSALLTREYLIAGKLGIDTRNITMMTAMRNLLSRQVVREYSGW